MSFNLTESFFFNKIDSDFIKTIALRSSLELNNDQQPKQNEM